VPILLIYLLNPCSLFCRLASKWLTNVEEQIQRAMRHYTLLIENRLREQREYGNDWPGKPVCLLSTVNLSSVLIRLQDDLLSWVMDAAMGQGDRDSVREISIRMLVMNIAAIHTTSAVSADN
jgi:hypothetical protein